MNILSASGKSVGKKELPAQIFEAEIPQQLLHEVVRWQRAKRRAGTHSTKTRAQVSGGGVKPYRQKGTGRARAGSNTSPLWIGGGVAHGPKPRKYDFKINKKERAQALRGVLSARAAEGNLVLVDDFGLTEVKTKAAAAVLTALGIEAGTSTLVVVSGDQPVLMRSLKNIAKVKTVEVAGLNVYDALYCKKVVIVGDALEAIEARLAA